MSTRAFILYCCIILWSTVFTGVAALVGGHYLAALCGGCSAVLGTTFGYMNRGGE